MKDVSAQRAAGRTVDDAVKELSFSFDLLATNGDDLTLRRRVLQSGRPLAVFAYGLGDLQPETVKQVGTAHCLAKGGDVQLAPAPAATTAIAEEAGKCEVRAEGGSVDPA